MRLVSAGIGAALVLLLSTPAYAQVDLAGEWGALNNVGEDQPHRVPGPDLGDYTGLPINAAARLKARSWDASVLSQPERQGQPHPAPYAARGGGPNLRIAKMVDPYSGQLIAYTFTGYFGRADRTIWMDGRPHPSEFAEHTWEGFSTGEWLPGGTLKVTTTHMKWGVIQRNGVATSPYAVMIEFWTRHNNHLGLFTWIDDPIYLEEPFVRSTDWIWNRTQNLGMPAPNDAADELGDRPLGWVPSWPMGTVHRDLAERFNIPFEATQGGKETIYPEYMEKIKTMQVAK